MPRTRSLSAVLLGATLFAAAACGDSTAPKPGPEPEPDPIFSIDVQTPMAGIETMRTVFAQPSFVSLHHTLGWVNGLFGFSPVPLSARSGGSGSALAPTSASRFLAPTAPLVANAIIDEALGKTYVFGTNSYVPDPAATGAPANGVRVVMHGFEETAQAPTLPLTRLGYADFTPVDGGNTATTAMRVRLVRDQGSAMLADYTVSRATSTGLEMFGATGTLTDGNVALQLDVAISISGTGASTSRSFHSMLSAPSNGIDVDFKTVSTGGAPAEPAQLTITYSGHVLSITFGDNGEVRLDRRLYGKITVTDGDYTFMKADGSPFTSQETADMRALINSAGLAILAWNHLVWS